MTWWSDRWSSKTTNSNCYMLMMLVVNGTWYACDQEAVPNAQSPQLRRPRCGYNALLSAQMNLGEQMHVRRVVIALRVAHLVVSAHDTKSMSSSPSPIPALAMKGCLNASSAVIRLAGSHSKHLSRNATASFSPASSPGCTFLPSLSF